jgi:hypothetical protein
MSRIFAGTGEPPTVPDVTDALARGHGRRAGTVHPQHPTVALAGR